MQNRAPIPATPLRLILLAAWTLLATLPNSSPAADTTDRMDVEVGLLRFDYTEFRDTGAILNQETGLLGGFAGTWRRTRDGLYFEASGSLHRGDVDYDGQTQDGVRAMSTSRTLLLGGTVRMGQQWRQGALYAGLEGRYWERDIQDTTDVTGRQVGGLYEEYTWRLWYAGAIARLWQGDGVQLDADLRLGRTQDASMRVDFCGAGAATLQLGASDYRRIAAALVIPVDRSARFVIEPWLERWEFGRSPIYPDCGGILEPRSETRHSGINASMHFDF